MAVINLDMVFRVSSLPVLVSSLTFCFQFPLVADGVVAVVKTEWAVGCVLHVRGIYVAICR
jgi:hypothetical protein